MATRYPSLDALGRAAVVGMERAAQRTVAAVGLGAFLVVGFLVLANANAVLSGHLLQSVPPATFLFWAFSVTGLVFMGRLVALHGPAALLIRRRSLPALIALNATTALNWLGFFYALRVVEPAIVTALMGGLGPLVTIGLERAVRGRRLPTATYVAATGILAGTAVLAWAAVSGASGLAGIGVGTAVLGLAAAAVGGTSQAMTVVAIKQLGDRGWRSSEIMAHRFHLLVVLAFVIAAAGPGLAVEGTGRAALVALVAAGGVIAPLWILQKGILLSEPFVVAALLAWAPILTLAFQSFDPRVDWSLASAAGCALVAAFTFRCFRVNYSRRSP